METNLKMNDGEILYVIHTSPKRENFVKKYMIPCFNRYGIEDILVWNDAEFKGQLIAWEECAYWILKNKKESIGTWHLEDDVIPCKDFKNRSIKLAQYGIITQGFITDNKFFDFKGKTGILPIDFLPWGMQCIYIPNFYLKGYIYFMENYVKTGNYKKRQYECGTLYSDNAFRGFLKKFCPNDVINNLDDCMVEHIDYLIGGRSVKSGREERRARKFDNQEELKNLEDWVRKGGTEWQDQE